MSRTSSKKAKGADIAAVPDIPAGKKTVRCTRVRILFDIDLLIDGKKAGDMDPMGSAIFEKDFNQTIELGKMVTSACAQIQEKIDSQGKGG